jgi:hypothetical protein
LIESTSGKGRTVIGRERGYLGAVYVEPQFVRPGGGTIDCKDDVIPGGRVAKNGAGCKNDTGGIKSEDACGSRVIQHQLGVRAAGGK